MNLINMLEKMAMYSKSGQVVTREEVRTDCFGLHDMWGVCTAGVDPEEVLFAELRRIRAIKLVDPNNHLGEMIVDANRARQLLDLFEIWETTDEPKSGSDCTCENYIRPGEEHNWSCPLSGKIESEVADLLQRLADR